jgi:hypothetical protein
MKNKILFVASILMGLLVGACGLVPSSKPVTDDAMQTEIVMLLTSMVTPTPIPEIVETEPPAEPTPTYNPSMVPGVLVTATPEPMLEPTSTPLPLDITPSAPTLEMLTFTPEAGGGTEELEATETPPAADPAEELGEADFSDTFDNGDNWSLGRDQYVDLKVSNGNLVMIGQTTTTGWRLTKPIIKDGYIQLIGKMIECSGADGFGLIVRVPNVTAANMGYLYGITCDGKFSFRKWDGEKMYTLINWKANDAIKKGSNQTNRLGISVVGKEIELYVNGTLVGTTRDSDFRSGGFGLFISAKETAKLTALFDEIKQWDE